MIDYFVMMAACLCMASVIETRLWRFDTIRQGLRYDGTSRLLYLIMTVWMVFFAGLRTRFNDTYNYMEDFVYFVPKGLSFSGGLSQYGGFMIYQRLLKTFITEDPQILIFVSALITTTLYMRYIVRHSHFYCGTIALFFFGLYVFSMGGIKQAIAIAIALYALDAFNRRRLVPAALMFLLAFSFQPYVVCLLVAPFLQERTWDKKTLLICMAAALAVGNLGWLLGFAAVIGKEYTITEFTDATINPFRVAIEAVPIYISFVNRKKINATQDKMLILGTNMNIIGFCFIFLGLFVNPMFMGRIATYFTALSMISIPKMLAVCYGKTKNRFLIQGYYLLMATYFVLDLTKLGSISLSLDRFKHISISMLIRVIFGG